MGSREIGGQLVTPCSPDLETNIVVNGIVVHHRAKTGSKVSRYSLVTIIDAPKTAVYDVAAREVAALEEQFYYPYDTDSRHSIRVNPSPLEVKVNKVLGLSNISIELLARLNGCEDPSDLCRLTGYNLGELERLGALAVCTVTDPSIDYPN